MRASIMEIIQHKLYYCIVLLLIIGVGCERDVQNDWVKKVLYFDNEQLRTNLINHAIDEVKAIETLPLKFEDDAGLSYQLNINPNISAEISYFKNIEDTTYKIIAFSASIHFSQEKQAVETYKSFENYFQKLYGVYDGTFGNQEWILPEQNYRISLKLQNEKKEILITCSLVS